MLNWQWPTVSRGFLHDFENRLWNRWIVCSISPDCCVVIIVINVMESSPSWSSSSSPLTTGDFMVTGRMERMICLTRYHYSYWILTLGSTLSTSPHQPQLNITHWWWWPAVTGAGLLLLLAIGHSKKPEVIGFQPRWETFSLIQFFCVPFGA